MKITNAILAEASQGFNTSELARMTDTARSTFFKYRSQEYQMNPSAENWLRMLIKLGCVKVKDGMITIKSPVISKDLLN